MFGRLQKYLTERRAQKTAQTLRDYELPDEDWHSALSFLSFLDRLTDAQLERLRELTTLFLVDKRIVGGAGFEVTPDMRIIIAAQACAPLIHLDLSLYNDFREVIVLPSAFKRDVEYEDEVGVVHRDNEPVLGEAWERGPVILNWPDAVAGGDFASTGMNLVVHEFAHKIDMADGEVNGMPPLLREQRARWLAAFYPAYNHHAERVAKDQLTWLDPYAAEHISEFFAVVTEVYVAEPLPLADEYPDVYECMNAYFKLWPHDL